MPKAPDRPEIPEGLHQAGKPKSPLLRPARPADAACRTHTHLDHVLDAAVGMLFNHGLDPDQGLDLSGRVKMALTTSRFTKPCFTEGKLRARDHWARCEPSTLLLGAPQLVPGWVRASEKTQETSPRTPWWGCLGKGQWCQRPLSSESSEPCIVKQAPGSPGCSWGAVPILGITSQT